MKRHIIVALLPILMAAVAGGQPAWAQSAGAQSNAQSAGQDSSAEIDLDIYYAFPISFGAEFQSLSPITDYGRDVSAFEILGIVRYPLPFYPLVQPIAQIGFMQFDVDDELHPERWDHTHIYGTVGAGYMTKFSKELEVGGELSLGYSHGIFRNLNPYFPDTSYASPSFLVSAGARVGFIPSFNISVNVHPNIKYLHSFSALKSFNGFLFNIGFSVSYRFGEDPDSASTIIRSIHFGEPQIQPLFAALQTYYTKNPIGTMTISNTETYPIYDIELQFFQNGLMDNPTKLTTIAELAPEEEREVNIFATFNSDIFVLEGLSPQTGELRAVYVSKGRTVEQKASVDYTMYDKTSLTWTDDRKIAGYITKSDSTIDNYTKQILQYTKNDINPGLSLRLQNAMQLYAALSEQGILYKVDPITAFDAAQGNTEVIDRISLPRDTLKFVTGDCDDLTVLYCSLLEIAGIPTGFITTPGHIYSAFNTGVPAGDYQTIHPDEDMIMNIKGEIWVPVEITMLGSDDFMAAWRRGAEEWNSYENDPTRRNFYETLAAQNIYTPIGLTAKDMGIQYANQKDVVERFNRDKDKLVSTILETYLVAAEESGDKRDYNVLGIMSAQFGRYEQAVVAFKRSISIDRNSISPQVNLGNVYLLLERYIDAIQIFHNVEEFLVSRGREDSLTHLKVLLSISRAYYELENFDKASEYYEMVSTKNPDLASEYDFIPKGAESSRGSDMASGKRILYIDEEE